MEVAPVGDGGRLPGETRLVSRLDLPVALRRLRRPP